MCNQFSKKRDAENKKYFTYEKKLIVLLYAFNQKD